jgi:ABC-type branched-subunit amino acid transport system substrate-binding protein
MPLRHRFSWHLLTVAILVLAACAPAPIDDRAPDMKIAFFQDLSVPDSLDLVSPSFLAFDTVMQREVIEAEAIDVEMVQLDTGGDAAAAEEMAREVAADPAFVLAVVAPFWEEPPEVARILAGAGVPTMSLSPESASPWLASPSPPGDPAELWRRFVPGREAQGELLAEVAERTSSGDPICLVRDGSTYSADLAAGIATALGRTASTDIDVSDPIAAARELASPRCGLVVWTGSLPGVWELAEAMHGEGSTRAEPIDLAGDALKTVVPPGALDGAGLVGSVVCPCSDVSVATDLASRSFLNIYQSEHGLTPGVYAAEAWDAGHIAADAITSGTTTREGMREAFRRIDSHEGVAGTYIFDLDGEPVGLGAQVFMAAGTRWLPIQG